MFFDKGGTYYNEKENNTTMTILLLVMTNEPFHEKTNIMDSAFCIDPDRERLN